MNNFQYDFIDVKVPDFDPEFFGLWLSKVIKGYEKTAGNLSFILCSDDYLLTMNKEFLDHDYYTDIITFDYSEEDVIAGDLFISYDRVVENSKSFGEGVVFDELCRVMVHGVLHLVGFNDKTDEERRVMRKEETKNLIKR